MSAGSKAGMSILIVAVAAAGFGFACGTHGAAQSSGPAGSATQVVKDSMGMCQMTIPEGWRVGKPGTIWAYGSEGSSAQLLVGPGTGTWEEEKSMAKGLFSDRKITILRDDSSTLTIEITPANPQGYSIVSVSPRRQGYCVVQLDSSAADARAKLAEDFKKIGDSVEALE